VREAKKAERASAGIGRTGRALRYVPSLDYSRKSKMMRLGGSGSTWAGS
jgi:hypothetical protein